MKNWKIAITLSIATSMLLAACGGEDGLKKAPTVNNAPLLKVARAGTPPPPKPPRPTAGNTPGPNAHSSRLPRSGKDHNRIRSKHNLPPLAWSDSLASYAQEWANELADNKGCKMEHRPSSGPFKQLHGENLYWASAIQWQDGRREAQDVNLRKVVDSWASEEQDYDYASNTCAPGKQCGHYTQIVWKSTTAVGCAFKQCSDKSQLWVCNYSPAGNYIGQKPY
jgi:uncharacterized protein YkwD